MQAPTLDTPIGELRLVQVEFVDGTTLDYYVHKDQVSAFITAKVQLHHSPGINPHAIPGSRPTKALSITVSPFTLFGPTWWTTPDLGVSDFNKGATLFITDVNKVTVWADEEHARLKDIEIASLDDAERIWNI